MCTRYFPKPKCIRSCIKTSTKDNVLILLTQMETSYINGLEYDFPCFGRSVYYVWIKWCALDIFLNQNV